MNLSKAMQQDIDNYIEIVTEAVAEADYLVYTGEWTQAQADKFLFNSYGITPAPTHTFSDGNVVPF